MGCSFWLAARVLLYASSHIQDNTYHSLCYASRGALAGTRNSSMGPHHEGSIRRPIAPWANALTTEPHLALSQLIVSNISMLCERLMSPLSEFQGVIVWAICVFLFTHKWAWWNWWFCCVISTELWQQAVRLLVFHVSFVTASCQIFVVKSLFRFFFF